MVVIVFLLGRPGSGKSAAARIISALAQNYGWIPRHINDFEIVQNMYLREKLLQFTVRSRKFRSREHGGFEILDFSVLDIALQEAEQRVREYMSQVRSFIIVEFARRDYREALYVFDPDIFQNAYFLFINSSLEACLERIHNRVAHPSSPDDIYVADDIMSDYYQQDNKPFMLSDFAKTYDILSDQVTILDNISDLRSFHKMLHDFIESILEHETYILYETDPLQAVQFVQEVPHRNSPA